MQELFYTVSFTTPAFLGNAEQQAQWRTPPFKALLRQWWRVAAAPQFNYDHHALREAEGILFGQAHEGDNRKSLVRFRLSQWDSGKLTRLKNSETVVHQEVQYNRGNIEANVYLGFGPVSTRGLAKPPAIEPEKQTAELWLGFPDANDEKIKQAVRLMGWFGTLGSRSRNGWGSLQMDGIQSPQAADLTPFSRSLSQCLQLDWPHAIGRD
ncbi:MAG: RAMP superfamily CRISPR-associated protein, partial [Thiothrix sp.]